MSNRIDYTKASPAGYKAFGGVYVYLQSCGLSKELINLVYLAGFANKWLRILHRHAFPRSAQARRCG